MIIQVCNQLDLWTITTFRNLEHLNVVSIKLDARYLHLQDWNDFKTFHFEIVR